MITDAQFATLVAVRNKYPAHVTPEQIGAILNEWAWLHKSEGCGMEAKPGGTAAIQPRTGIHIWNGVRLAGNLGQDVLSGASAGIATPVRGTVGPADPATFVAPVEPLGTVDPPQPVDLERRVASLERTIAEHENLMAGLASRIEDLQVQITNLQHVPPPFVLPPLRVTGSTGRSFGHSHSIDLTVVPK